MDIWGAGCVLYEIITRVPLFPGSNELDQLHKIHDVTGTPSPKLVKKLQGYDDPSELTLSGPENYRRTTIFHQKKEQVFNPCYRTCHPTVLIFSWPC